MAKASGREGLELVMPAVLDVLLTLGADAQACHKHLVSSVYLLRARHKLPERAQ